MFFLAVLPGTALAKVDGRGVDGAFCEVVRVERRVRAGVRVDVEEVPDGGTVLVLRLTEAVDVIDEVDETREDGVGLTTGLAAGVLAEGLPSEGLGDAEGEARADELVEVTRDAGLALKRLLALGVAGGGEIRLERADEEVTEDGRDADFAYVQSTYQLEAELWQTLQYGICIVKASFVHATYPRRLRDNKDFILFRNCLVLNFVQRDVFFYHRTFLLLVIVLI